MTTAFSTALPALLNETYKGLIIRWSYRFNLLMEVVSLGAIFLGITFLMGGGDLEPQQLTWTLIGYIVWFYALLAISNMSWSLREETQTGTLEQMYMSPAPMGVLLIGRTLSALIITTIMVTLLVLPMTIWLDVQIPLRATGLPVFLLTVMGLYGFGFMIGGATLLFKQVEALANLMQNLLLFMNGTLLAVDQFPGWLEGFTKALPSTQGIIVLRNVLLEGQSLGAAWADGSLVALLINSTIYFAGGLVVFKVCEHVAQRKGSLGQY